MRDGVSYFFERYSKGNNNYLNSYDPKQESKHVTYFFKFFFSTFFLLFPYNFFGYTISKLFQQASLNG